MKATYIIRFGMSFLSFAFSPIKYLIPKSNIIILGTSTRYCFRDNTRYLLEYLHLRGMTQIYWVTDSKEIIEYLESRGIQHIGWKSPLKMLWIALRAKIVIDTGNKFFNPFNILNSRNTIKISTMHGRA